MEDFEQIRQRIESALARLEVVAETYASRSEEESSKLRDLRQVHQSLKDENASLRHLAAQTADRLDRALDRLNSLLAEEGTEA